MNTTYYLHEEYKTFIFPEVADCHFNVCIFHSIYKLKRSWWPWSWRILQQQTLNVSLKLQTAAGMLLLHVTSGSKSEEAGNFALNIKSWARWRKILICSKSQYANLLATKHFVFQLSAPSHWFMNISFSNWLVGLLEALVNISLDLSPNWSLSSLTDDLAVWRNARCEMKAVAPLSISLKMQHRTCRRWAVMSGSRHLGPQWVLFI